MKDSILAAQPPRQGLPSPAHALLTAIASRIACGELSIVLPDGSTRQFRGVDDGTPSATWRLHGYRTLWRILTRGALGLGEGYMAGEWDSPALADFMLLAAMNEREFEQVGGGHRLLRAVDRVRHLARRNSRRRAARNIAYHYDLGNAFYAHWLDPSMTYSAAIFDGTGDSLAVAQARKYQRLIDLLAIESSHEVLEIGCGWGGFLEYAARVTGARLQGISISREQCAYARERLAAAALDDRARVDYRDYRDQRGRYDRIVSIEMFEAVGEAYWDVYAGTLARLLAPSGRAGLQVITIDEGRFATYRRDADFIQRYIFPGGMLPTRRGLTDLFARHGLRCSDEFAFGRDYARTLVAWRQRFEAAWPRLLELGFDERFRRMWNFYLTYCEAGFLSGAIDVVQVRLERA